MVSVNEQRAIGTVAFSFKAVDEDAGEVLQYFIDGGNDNHDGSPAFDIDSSSGDVFFASTLNYEVGPQAYNLTIRVQDSRTQPSFVLLQVAVTVTGEVMQVSII